MANPDLSNLVKEAQKMQAKIQETQKELENLIVVGEAGGGLVKVEMTGRHYVKRTIVDPSVVNANEIAMLEDLISAAFNDAVNKIERETRKKMSFLSQGMSLPPDMQAPLKGE
jgi:DNA-binding YbaB/EbfC family protein